MTARGATSPLLLGAYAIAGVGLLTGVLALRRVRIWKWLGLGCSVAFLWLVDTIWSTFFGTWREMLEQVPLRWFDLVAMPVAVGVLGVVASGFIVWRK